MVLFGKVILIAPHHRTVRIDDDKIVRRHRINVIHLLGNRTLYFDKRRYLRIVCVGKRGRDFADNERHGRKRVVTRNRNKVGSYIGDKRLQQRAVFLRRVQIGFTLHPRHALHLYGVAVLGELGIHARKIIHETLILHAHRRGHTHRTAAPLGTRTPVSEIAVLSCDLVSSYTRAASGRLEHERFVTAFIFFIEFFGDSVFGTDKTRCSAQPLFDRGLKGIFEITLRSVAV